MYGVLEVMGHDRFACILFRWPENEVRGTVETQASTYGHGVGREQINYSRDTPVDNIYAPKP